MTAPAVSRTMTPPMLNCLTTVGCCLPPGPPREAIAARLENCCWFRMYSFCPVPLFTRVVPGGTVPPWSYPRIRPPEGCGGVRAAVPLLDVVDAPVDLRLPVAECDGTM